MTGNTINAYADGMVVCHFPYGPTTFFSLHNVVLRHDIESSGNVSEMAPHLIFQNFNTKLGERVKSILKHLFPVPKVESQRTMTFVNDQDFISFRFGVRMKLSACLILIDITFFKKLVIRRLRWLKLVRDLSWNVSVIKVYTNIVAYMIKLGTVDVSEADEEWVLHSFMRTSKKRDFL